MSELKTARLSPGLVKSARFIGTFSNRFFITFIAMTLGFGIAKKVMNFKSSPLAPYAFYISCIMVTAIWSYYLIQMTPPLIYRTLRKSEKSKLIKSQISMIVFFLILIQLFKSVINKDGGIFFLPVSMVLSVSVFSSFITLLVLLSKQTVHYNKHRNVKAEKQSTHREREAGKEGEANITYELSHLNKEKSTTFHNITIKVKDDVQQLDNLVIGENGIYNIETKTFSGKIRIDELGNWSRDSQYNGIWKGMKNPLAQTQRHRRALVSLFGDKYPIYDIIAMGNEETVIEGASNSPIPILTQGTLQYYIEEKTKGERLITASERQALSDKLKNAIIENKTF